MEIEKNNLTLRQLDVAVNASRFPGGYVDMVKEPDSSLATLRLLDSDVATVTSDGTVIPKKGISLSFGKDTPISGKFEEVEGVIVRRI